jgi:hypothetical protein
MKFKGKPTKYQLIRGPSGVRRYHSVAPQLRPFGGQIRVLPQVRADLQAGPYGFRGRLRIDFSDFDNETAASIEASVGELTSEGTLPESEVQVPPDYLPLFVTALNNLPAFRSLCGHLLRHHLALNVVTGFGLAGFLKAASAANLLLLIPLIV